jgi:GNAT superfamily N-acetyltransferase
MGINIVPAGQINLAAQADVSNAAFSDYLISFPKMDVAGLGRFLCSHDVDLCYSRFALDAAGAPASFGYINRTGNISRLAGMATVPGARRTGAAASLLSQLITEAKARGDEAMMLEVFEQNLPAHTLYVRNGFREVTRLFGWRGRHQAATTKLEEVTEISLLAATRRQSAFDYPDWPWQISRFAIAKLAVGHAFSSNNACVVVGDPEVKPIRIHAFAGIDGRNWETARKITGAVMAKWPEDEFFAPQLFPEPIGREVFEPLGFKREPLNQFLMRKDL